MDFYDEKGNIICQLCGSSFLKISDTHLKKHHQIGMKEYRTQFSEAPLCARIRNQKEISKNTKLDKVNLDEECITDEDYLEKDKEHHQEIEKENEKILDEILNPSVHPGISIDEKKLNGKTPLINKIHVDHSIKHEKENLKNVIPAKAKVIEFLRIFYPDIKNNYIIEKFGVSKDLLYRLVTDMADPISLVIFDFPNAFWHNNVKMTPNVLSYIKRDGWKIFTIKDKAGSINEIQKILEANGIK